MAVDLILQILFPFLLQMFTGGVFFLSKLRRVRHDVREKTSCIGMQECDECAQTNKENFVKLTQKVWIWGVAANRGLGHFPPSSKRNNFPLIRVYVEGARRVFYIIRCHGLTPRPPALKTFGFADECRLCRSFGSLITIKAPIWFSTVSVERKSRPTWSESPLDTLQSLSFSFREMDTDCHPAEKYLDDGLRCISRCSPSSGQLPRCFLIWTELTIYSLSQKKNLGNGFFRGPTTGGLITGTRERESSFIRDHKLLYHTILWAETFFFTTPVSL